MPMNYEYLDDTLKEELFHFPFFPTEAHQKRKSSVHPENA